MRHEGKYKEKRGDEEEGKRKTEKGKTRQNGSKEGK